MWLEIKPPLFLYNRLFPSLRADHAGTDGNEPECPEAQNSKPAGRLSAPGKGGRVVPHSPKWHQLLGAQALWVVVSLISVTIRYRVRDPHGFMTRKDLRQVIYCTWHNRLALSMKLNSIFGSRQHRTTGLAGLVSASKDGAFLSAILACFGVQSVCGSSSRRGRRRCSN